MDVPLLEVVLPIELTNGNGGRGHKWFASNSERQRHEKTLVAMGLRRKPFEFPVLVRVTRIMGKGQRLWDASSGLRGNWKELEDAMVACGWFVDDGPSFIDEVQFRQDKKRREKPAVMVQVFRR